MIDSRFLNLETRIDGILEGDDDYCQITTSRVANGKRYLVLGTDTEYEYHNCIVYNDNGTLVSTPARKGMPPVIDNRGNILSYNGTSWEGIGHVGAILVEDIVDFVCTNAESSTVQNKFSDKVGVKFLMTLYAYEESAAILISTGNGVTCVMSEKTIFVDNSYSVNGGFCYLANNEDGKVYYTMPFSTSSTDGAVPIPIEVGAGAVVIHKSTGKAYTYDGTAHKWIPASGIFVKYIDDIIDCDYTSSEQDENIMKAGTKFISTNNYNYYDARYIYTADGNGGTNSSPDMSNSNEYIGYCVVDASGNLYVFGRYYNCSSPGTILDDDGAYWVKYGQVPASERKNTLFISKADYSMYQVDVSSGNLVKIGESAAGITNEVFTLSESNITNKSITLSSSVASGKTGSVLVFLGGAVHTAGTDFSVSGTALSWNGLALDTAGLKEGDKVIVQYVPAE